MIHYITEFNKQIEIADDRLKRNRRKRDYLRVMMKLVGFLNK